MSEPGEEAERVQEQVQSLPEALFADVLDTVFNVNTAGTAQSHAAAIEGFVQSGIDFNSGFAGFLAEIGSLGNFDGFLFLLERHCGHRNVSNSTERTRYSYCGEIFTFANDS